MSGAKPVGQHPERVKLNSNTLEDDLFLSDSDSDVEPEVPHSEHLQLPESNLDDDLYLSDSESEVETERHQSECLKLQMNALLDDDLYLSDSSTDKETATTLFEFPENSLADDLLLSDSESEVESVTSPCECCELPIGNLNDNHSLINMESTAQHLELLKVPSNRLEDDLLLSESDNEVASETSPIRSPEIEDLFLTDFKTSSPTEVGPLTPLHDWPDLPDVNFEDDASLRDLGTEVERSAPPCASPKFPRIEDDPEMCNSETQFGPPTPHTVWPDHPSNSLEDDPYLSDSGTEMDPATPRSDWSEDPVKCHLKTNVEPPTPHTVWPDLNGSFSSKSWTEMDSATPLTEPGSIYVGNFYQGNLETRFEPPTPHTEWPDHPNNNFEDDLYLSDSGTEMDPATPRSSWSEESVKSIKSDFYHGYLPTKAEPPTPHSSWPDQDGSFSIKSWTEEDTATPHTQWPELW